MELSSEFQREGASAVSDPCRLFSEKGEHKVFVDSDSEEGAPPTLRTLDDPPQRNARRFVRRKEVEARRFSGKENIEEYLLQFELTSRRNGWVDDEKAAALLCALDGSARGILAEFDDPVAASYNDVKQALLRRFGPTRLVEVHEQALAQLRLAKGQSIRELSQEVQRLVKQAYPDVVGPPRDRFAVKHLLNAIHDKDTVFYIREKDPADITEACTLYERYTALVGEDHSSRRTNIRGVNDARSDSPSSVDTSALQRQVTEAIERMTNATNQQLQNLTDAMAQLKPPAVAETVRPPPSSQSRAADARPPPAFVPRKPCPRCGQLGHWARDCTQGQRQPSPTDACFRCGQPGHRQRECMNSLNTYGPMPAPSVGPRPPHRP